MLPLMLLRYPYALVFIFSDRFGILTWPSEGLCQKPLWLRLPLQVQPSLSSLQLTSTIKQIQTPSMSRILLMSWCNKDIIYLIVQKIQLLLIHNIVKDTWSKFLFNFILSCTIAALLALHMEPSMNSTSLLKVVRLGSKSWGCQEDLMELVRVTSYIFMWLDQFNSVSKNMIIINNFYLIQIRYKLHLQVNISC